MPPSQDWQLEPTITARAARRSIGQYDLIEPLGRGGMGVVWKAVHRHLEQTVAIKFLSPDSWSDQEAVARFYREMRAVGRVIHPNLVRALDAGEYDGHHVLVMECVPGMTVRELLVKAGPLPVAAACEIARQAALGLSAIASADLVHRDLKPSNLILTTDGQVKILDLGLARFAVEADEQELTTSRNLLGTIDYMSPEQSQDARTADSRSDLYSLGGTLFAMLTGKSPFGGGPHSSMESRLRAIREEIPPCIKLLRPDVPLVLSDLIAVLLSKRPEDRTLSAKELAESLAPFASSVTLESLLQPAHLVADQSVEVSTSKKRDDTSKPDTFGGMATVSTLHVPFTGGIINGSSQELNQRLRARTRLLFGAVAGLITVVVWATIGWHPGPLKSPTAGLSPAEIETADATSHVAPSDAILDLTASVPLEWKDLLERAPVPVFWPRGEGLSRWEWLDKQEQLTISNSEWGLLALGRINAKSFRLQVGIHQNGWPGGVGIFIGLPAADDFHSDWSCEQFLIQSMPDEGGPSRCRIDFASLTKRSNEDHRRAIQVTTKASEVLRRPVGEVILELTIANQRLTKLSLDGVDCADLVQSVNEISPAVSWSGTFGVSVQGGDATIRRSRLMVLEGAAGDAP